MTKAHWDPNKERLVNLGNALTPHDHLPFPGSRKIPQIESPELTRLLFAYGIPGVSASHGREVNLAAYAKHLDGIRKQAADNAISEWLKGHEA